jgi:hypothetical protein
MLILLAGLLVVSFGCKSKHPSSEVINEDFDPNQVTMILVAPFVSSIIEGEDPERESEKIMNRILWQMISERQDYDFHSPNQFLAYIGREGAVEEYEKFQQIWIKEHTVDPEFLRAIQLTATYDMLLIPHVYTWWKDETDYRELNAVSSTQIGATLTLVDFKTGEIMWEATDENYKESVRSEGDRVQVSSAGMHRRVEGVSATGSDMYAAPPFEDVAILVLRVLVDAIPSRGI